MASILLKSELVNLNDKLYKMTWWATALNQISAPSGMVMSGGSTAFITTSSGVKTYIYNSNAKQWKEYSPLGSINETVSSLETSLEELLTESPQIEMGLNNTTTVSANSTATFDVEFTHDWSEGWETPNVFLDLRTSETGAYLDKVFVSVSARSTSGFTVLIKNTDSVSRNPSIMWLAITKRVSGSGGA